MWFEITLALLFSLHGICAYFWLNAVHKAQKILRVRIEFLEDQCERDESFHKLVGDFCAKYAGNAERFKTNFEMIFEDIALLKYRTGLHKGPLSRRN